MMLYLAHRGLGIVPGIIPLFVAVIQIYVAEKIRGKNYYFPTNLPGYLTLNISFLIVFLFVLFYLKEVEPFIKIGTFIIMSIIGIYTSFFILRVRMTKNR